MFSIEKLPYKLCENVYSQIIEDKVFYVDVRRNLCVQVSYHDHKCIFENRFPDSSIKNIREVENSLLSLGIIEPDISKLTVGKTSIYNVTPSSIPKEIKTVSEVFIDNISILEGLHTRGYVNDKTKINFIYNGCEPIPAHLKISGSIIINDYDLLDGVANIRCAKLIIETDSVPSNDTIGKINRVCKICPVQINLEYSISPEVATKIKRILPPRNDKMLTITYEYCCLTKNSLKNINEKYKIAPNIAHESIRRIKLSCGAGISKYYISSNGDIYACYRMRNGIPLGNIYKDDYYDFLHTDCRAELSIPKECRTCNVFFFCGGGCKAKWNESLRKSCLRMKSLIEDELSGKHKELDLDYITGQKDATHLIYMCERNALRVLLRGYHIETPLSLMRFGLYFENNDFYNTGVFSTAFSRLLFDPRDLPILGKKANSLDWDIIDAHLKKKQPVIITVDVFFMPYKKNTYFQKTHGSHSVILLKKTKTGYVVLDWYHPDYFLGEIGYLDLTLARTSQNAGDSLNSFSGKPINSEYQLIHMENLPEIIEVEKCFKRNLYESVKCMLGKYGILAFLDLYSSSTPKWLHECNDDAYKRAIQSFFFLELELAFFGECISEAIEKRIWICDNYSLIVNLLKEMEISTQQLKSMLLIAYKKRQLLDGHKWCAQIEKMKTAFYSFCEMQIVIFLKQP